MSNIAFYVSIFFAFLSLAFSLVAIRRSKETKRLHSVSLENLRAAHQIREQVNEIARSRADDETIEKVKNGDPIYPRYREYGDLS